MADDQSDPFPNAAISYLERIFAASSIEEVWGHHIDQMGAYGFDRLLYGFTRFKPQNSIGSPSDSLVLTNHPPAYIKEYVEDELYHHGPVMRWLAENSGPCSWNYMHERLSAPDLSEGERKLASCNFRHNVKYGYSIGFRADKARAKGGIGLCAREGLTQDDVEGIWADHGREILVLNNAFHLRVSTLPYTMGKPLTARQREVLEWISDGKTVQDIALIMGLTIPTIEKHLRLARECLNVDTTAQAIIRATYSNQIFIVPDPDAG